MYLSASTDELAQREIGWQPDAGLFFCLNPAFGTNTRARGIAEKASKLNIIAAKLVELAVSRLLVNVTKRLVR